MPKRTAYLVKGSKAIEVTVVSEKRGTSIVEYRQRVKDLAEQMTGHSAFFFPRYETITEAIPTKELFEKEES